MDVIFVPIACPVCSRHSASPYRKSELKRKLESGDVIQVRCGYDDQTWDATQRERRLMMQLSKEDDAVSLISRLPRPDASHIAGI